MPLQKSSLIGLVCVLSIGFVSRPCRADLTTLVPTIKSATALVRVTRPDGGTSIGTAFCIDTTGIFITSNQVTGAAGDNVFQLVLHAGDANEQVLKAHVLRSDNDLDLALIAVDHPPALTALNFGDNGNLVETLQLTVFGFPTFVTSATSQSASAISVSRVYVTTLRKTNGELQLVQLDKVLNRGYTGAPVVDDNGQVMGVVAGGMLNQQCFVPPSRIQKMLSKPDVVMMPTRIAFDKRHEETDFRVKVASYMKAAPTYSVKLKLGSDPDAQAVAMQARVDGDYTAKIVPIPTPVGPQAVRLKALFKGGAIECAVSDQTLKIGNQTVNLSEVRSLALGDHPHATLMNEKDISGAVAGLAEATADFGDMSASINLSKALSLNVYPPPPQSSSLDYQLTVTTEGKVAADVTGSIQLVGAPAQSASSVALAIGETPLNADVVQIKMPGLIDDVVAGAGGRYLFLQIKSLRKLAVFDVSSGAIAKYISLPSDDCLVAADADKLLIFIRDQKLIQRYDLRSMQEELTVQMPDIAELDGLALGYASSGPLMVMTRQGPKFMDVHSCHWLEMNGMERLGFWSPHPQYPLVAHASADGTTFAAWQPGLSPSGVRLMVVNGNNVESKYRHESAGVLLPSFDGSLLFTSMGIYSADLLAVDAENFREVQCFPAYDANYFVGVRAARGFGRQVPELPEIMIYSTSDHHLLTTLSNYNEFMPGGNNAVPLVGRRFNEMGLEKRIAFIPSAKLIVTIPDSRDRIVLHRFDVVAALDKAGVDYLFVASVPQRVACRGGRYNYTINVKSKRGAVQMSLQSGPPGMTLSPNGVLNWDVPGELGESAVGVIVSIKDASDQQIYHSFNISISPKTESGN